MQTDMLLDEDKKGLTQTRGRGWKRVARGRRNLGHVPGIS